MLSIWRDNLKSPAAIKQLLTVLMQTFNYLNPGQTAVVGLYQGHMLLPKEFSGFYQTTMTKETLFPCLVPCALKW